MGTISDKLMRIINTKEDIRQALISKGYDVPTSIPFKEYAKMILDLPCNADSFPDIEGIVARYSASGLTNEQMATNPVWVDKTGNGYDLQLKNFAWKGMSGVGGYVQDFNDFRNNATVDKVRIDEQSSNSIKVTLLTSGMGHVIYIPKGVYQFNKSYFIKISSEGYNEGDLFLSFYAPSTSTATTVKVPLNPNGITEIPAIKEDDFLAVYLFNAVGKVGSITIEQLPLYPGFILGDGVDDFAVTEKELNFEDTYTVYTAFIPFQNNPTRNMILCGADSKKTFSMQYSSLVYVSFIAGNNYYINADFVNGLNLFACKRNGNNICIKNLLTNKVVTGTCGDWVENAGLYYLWKNATYASFAKAAIAGQTICNGYFSTDEDDEKVLNWYKKQYPWLFPDQAWTVVGKTNEDEDRATIANITGNGNDLVLSNFRFAEGSGYGLYAYNFNSFNLRDNVVKPTDVKKDSFRIIGTGNSSNVLILTNESDSANWKIRITGMKEGDSCIVGNANKSDDYIKIIKDGIYTFQKQYAATSVNGIWYNSSQEVDVLVEQIPEYEGYLVTDGVDDIASSNTVVYEADFTFIGEWKFIQKDDTVAGINSVSHLYIQNRYNRGATVMINSTFENKKNITDYMTFKAITSKGKAYDENWNEVDLLYGDGNKGPSQVSIGGQGGSDFCHMIFKNMALYMNKVFSKDECIKAYNYLQTLKSK